MEISYSIPRKAVGPMYISGECEVCDRLRSRIIEALARSGCSLIEHSVYIDFSYRWLACLPLYFAIS